MRRLTQSVKMLLAMGAMSLVLYTGFAAAKMMVRQAPEGFVAVPGISSNVAKIQINGDDVWALDTTGKLFYINKKWLGFAPSEIPIPKSQWGIWQSIKVPKNDGTRAGDFVVGDDDEVWLLGGAYSEKEGGFSLYQGKVKKSKKDGAVAVSWDKNDTKLTSIDVGKKQLFQTQHLWGVNAQGKLFCKKQTSRREGGIVRQFRGITSGGRVSWIKIKATEKQSVATVVADAHDHVMLKDSAGKLYVLKISKNSILGDNFDDSKLDAQDVGVAVSALINSELVLGSDGLLYSLAKAAEGKKSVAKAQKIDLQIAGAPLQIVVAATSDAGDLLCVTNNGKWYFGAGYFKKDTKKKDKPESLDQKPVGISAESEEPRRVDWCGTMIHLNQGKEAEQQNTDAAPSAPVGPIKESFEYVGTGQPTSAEPSGNAAQ